MKYLEEMIYIVSNDLTIQTII